MDHENHEQNAPIHPQEAGYHTGSGPEAAATTCDTPCHPSGCGRSRANHPRRHLAGHSGALQRPLWGRWARTTKRAMAIAVSESRALARESMPGAPLAISETDIARRAISAVATCKGDPGPDGVPCESMKLLGPKCISAITAALTSCCRDLGTPGMPTVWRDSRLPLIPQNQAKNSDSGVRSVPPESASMAPSWTRRTT